MMESIQMAIPDVEVQCFDLGSVSIQQQVLLVEQASVHVSPHGGLSYLSLFAQEGASLVLLVRRGQRFPQRLFVTFCQVRCCDSRTQQHHVTPRNQSMRLFLLIGAKESAS
jgi:hypothetical protein